MITETTAYYLVIEGQLKLKDDGTIEYLEGYDPLTCKEMFKECFPSAAAQLE